MLNRRHVLVALAGTAMLPVGSAAFATERTPFEDKAFAAAQTAGKSILVEISAPWCPVCKAQAPILSKLDAEPRFHNMVKFNIDFDSQKDLLRRFNVQKQSTLIAFKGSQETGRSTGDTNPTSIEALLSKTI